MFKSFITVVMVIAFLAQSFVPSVMACEMSMHSSPDSSTQAPVNSNSEHAEHHGMTAQTKDHSMMGHSMMDHSMIDHSMVEHDQMASASSQSHGMMQHADASDCCGEDCKCPANACTSHSFIHVVLNFESHTLLAEKIASATQTFSNPHSISPFRPPIAA